jgi:putative tricarboxylic transport membrane protein
MSDSSHPVSDGPSQRTIEIGVAIGMIVFSTVVIYGSLQAGINWGAEGPRAGFFPFYVALVVVLASAVNLVRIAMDGGESRRLFAEWGQLRQVMAVILPTTAYVLLIPWLGLYAASLLLIAVFMRWLGNYRWSLVAAVSVGVPLVAYVMFEKWFLVPLPKGPVEDFLGL